MIGSREGYLTEVYKNIRGMERLARNQLLTISFSKGTKNYQKMSAGARLRTNMRREFFMS